MEQNTYFDHTQITFRHRTTTGEVGMHASLHCHNYFEIIYLVSGDVAHVVEGRHYRVKAGDLVLVRPSTAHYLEILSDEPYIRYNILFDPERHGVPAALELPVEMEVVDISHNALLKDLFARLDLYAQSEQADFEVLLRLLLNELCMNLLLFPEGQQTQQPIESPMLTRVLDYINENLFRIQSIEQVAQDLFLSPSYLYAHFRDTLHKSPKKYILEKRLLAAQRKIRSGGKPTDVCWECGFREYSTFYRNFVSYFGYSPSEEH